MALNKKIRVLSKVYDVLLMVIKNRFEQDCLEKGYPVPSNVRSYYGFGNRKDEEEYSLFDSMRDDHKKKEKLWQEWKLRQEQKNDLVDADYMGKNLEEDYEPIRYTRKEQIMSVPAKYLYDREREAKDSHAYRTLDIDRDYLSLSVKYIGYNNLHDFLDDPITAELLNEKDRNLQIEIENKPKDQLSDQKVRFYGYYFTNKAQPHREKFLLDMDFRNRYESRTFRVELHEFHKTQEDDQKDSKFRDNTIYRGDAVESGTFIHMKLSEKINERILNIFCHKNFAHIENQKWMHCIVAAISKNTMPISLEAILVREDALEQENLEPFIDAYLQLRRNNIRLPEETISHPRELKSRLTTTAVKEIELLPGNYRIWNFRWDWQREPGIMQSKLTVHSNFQSNIETVYTITQEGHGKERKKQLSVISISKVKDGRKKLCLASHTPINDGMEVINYAILDIHHAMEEGHLSKGVFCGQRGPRLNQTDTAMAAEPLIFMKDSSDFNSERLTVKEINALISKEPGNPYFRMLQKLFKSYGINNETIKHSFLKEIQQDDLKNLGKRERFLYSLNQLYRQTILSPPS